MATQKERSSSNGSPGTTPTPPPASGLQTVEGTATRPRATSSETPANQTVAFDPDMMEKFFSFMSFYEQYQQGTPAQSNNSNNNNATPMSLDGSSYARGNQQQPTFAPYEPQRGSVSFMPRQQPSPEQEKTLEALQILGFFDGSLPYPTHGTQYDKQQYTYQSMMAYTILLRNITPNQQQNMRSYRGYGNSAELAYYHLKNLYQATDCVNQSRLMAQLTVEMKPGEKGMANISRCRELHDKLLRCGGSISEDAFVTVIIGGVGPQWRSTRAILRAHGKISEAALCAEIHAEQQDMDLQEERHKKKASVPEFAFHIQRRYNNNNYRHQPKPVPPFCHLCKTSGHPQGLGYNLLSVSQMMAKGIHLEADSTTQEFKLYNGKGGLYIGKAVLKNNVFVLDFVPDLGTTDSNRIVTFTSWTHPPDLDPDFSPEGFWYSHTIPETERTRALATIQHSAAVKTTSTTAETTSAAAETTSAAAETTWAAAETTAAAAATSTPIAGPSTASAQIDNTPPTPAQQLNPTPREVHRTEAEYIALCSATKEGLYLRELLEEAKLAQLPSFSLFCDNQSAIRIANKNGFANRTKHIALRYFFVKDKIEKGRLELSYCPTSKMAADYLTKKLGKQKFEYCMLLTGQSHVTSSDTPEAKGSVGNN
ncbi:unnamed protein product [Closterium sp. NIES-53]